MKKQESQTKSTPEAKGERLRRVRNIANLSREEFCSDGSVNIHTLAGWELGRFGGLSRNGAIIVAHRVAKEGVHCTVEWLLHDIGVSPYLIPKIDVTNNNIQNQKNIDNSYHEEVNNLITDELICFRSHYKEILELSVTDNSMAPYYNIGDHVAGKKIYEDDIAKLIGKDCIVNTENGLLLLRNLRQGTTDNHYTLISLNAFTQSNNSILYDIKITSAAPIYWHRKKDFL